MTMTAAEQGGRPRANGAEDWNRWPPAQIAAMGRGRPLERKLTHSPMESREVQPLGLVRSKFLAGMTRRDIRKTAQQATIPLLSSGREVDHPGIGLPDRKNERG